MSPRSFAPRLPSLFWPSPPPSAARLRCPVFAAPVAAGLQKADRCPCSASAVSAAGSASAAQSRTRGRLPSQSRRPCGRLASSPGGRAKFTPVGRGKPCGKINFSLLCLTTNFAKIDAGTLASPRGGGGTALCAVTERGGSHVYGGAVERSETERAKSWPQRSDQTKKKSAR